MWAATDPEKRDSQKTEALQEIAFILKQIQKEIADLATAVRELAVKTES